MQEKLTAYIASAKYTSFDYFEEFTASDNGDSRKYTQGLALIEI